MAATASESSREHRHAFDAAVASILPWMSVTSPGRRVETSFPALVAWELNGGGPTLREPAASLLVAIPSPAQVQPLASPAPSPLGALAEAHSSRHTHLGDFLPWLSSLRRSALNLLSLSLIDECCSPFTERSICVPFGCRCPAVFVRSIIRTLTRDRIQAEFHLSLIGPRARRPFATDRLNGCRVTSHRFENARQDAWSNRRLCQQWGLVLLDICCDLGRCQHKQVPWRELMTLTLNAGLLDLNRERLRIALHFMC